MSQQFCPGLPLKSIPKIWLLQKQDTTADGLENSVLKYSKEVKINLGFVLNILSLEKKISEKLYKHPGEGGISKTLFCSLKYVSVLLYMLGFNKTYKTTECPNEKQHYFTSTKHKTMVFCSVSKILWIRKGYQILIPWLFRYVKNYLR